MLGDVLWVAVWGVSNLTVRLCFSTWFGTVNFQFWEQALGNPRHALSYEALKVRRCRKKTRMKKTIWLNNFRWIKQTVMFLSFFYRYNLTIDSPNLSIPNNFSPYVLWLQRCWWPANLFLVFFISLSISSVAKNCPQMKVIKWEHFHISLKHPACVVL